MPGFPAYTLLWTDLLLRTIAALLSLAGTVTIGFLLTSLYVTIDPDPLDTGPEPGVHWLVWIVERAGERL